MGGARGIFPPRRYVAGAATGIPLAEEPGLAQLVPGNGELISSLNSVTDFSARTGPIGLKFVPSSYCPKHKQSLTRGHNKCSGIKLKEGMVGRRDGEEESENCVKASRAFTMSPLRHPPGKLTASSVKAKGN